MSKDKTLFVTEVKEGDTFNHNGSIVFKVFVPNGVKAVTYDGGIVLEQGGGNNLTLAARTAQRGNSGVHISGRGNSISISTSGTSSVIMTGGRVIVDGQDVTGQFNNTSSQPMLTGVTAKAALGNSVYILTDSSVSLQDAGSFLKVEADGSVSCGSVGNCTTMTAKGSINAGNFADEAQVQAAGSIQAARLGNKGLFRAGGSVNVGEVGENTALKAGGSINAGNAKEKANLQAGGSINLAAASTGVSTRAGGSIVVAGQRKSGSRFDF